MPARPKADWALVEVEYITGTMTLADLAQKYHLDISTLERHSSKSNWQGKRRLYDGQVSVKAIADTAEKVGATISEERSRMVKFIDAVLSTGLVQLVGRKDPNTGEWIVKPETKVGARDILEAAKLKLVLLGETVDRSDMAMKGTVDHVFRVVYGEEDQGKTKKNEHDSLDDGAPDTPDPAPPETA